MLVQQTVPTASALRTTPTSLCRAVPNVATQLVCNASSALANPASVNRTPLLCVNRTIAVAATASGTLPNCKATSLVLQKGCNLPPANKGPLSTTPSSRERAQPATCEEEVMSKRDPLVI